MSLFSPTTLSISSSVLLAIFYLLICYLVLFTNLSSSILFTYMFISFISSSLNPAPNISILNCCLIISSLWTRSCLIRLISRRICISVLTVSGLVSEAYVKISLTTALYIFIFDNDMHHIQPHHKAPYDYFVNACQSTPYQTVKFLFALCFRCLNEEPN